jgi:hypothetical protein
MALVPRSCEQARGWVSLSLDDELSEFEILLLRAHVAKCPACAAFEADAQALTAMLRAAPLEPAPPPMTIERRRRSRQPLVRAAASVAAFLVVVGGTSEIVRQPGSRASHDPRAPVPKPSAAQLLADRLNWQGGLPTVKPSQKQAPLGQRPGANPNQF